MSLWILLQKSSEARLYRRHRYQCEKERADVEPKRVVKLTEECRLRDVSAG